MSPEMHLLIVCSRLRPGRESLLSAAQGVEHWAEVVTLARHHLVVPLVHRHLSELQSDLVPSSALAALSVERKEAVRKTLLQQAELRELVDKHLEPKHIRFLPFKGLTIAGRYYGDPMLRQSRDIDVLIDPERLRDLTTGLLASGYRLRSEEFVNGEDDLYAYGKLFVDVAVISPRGVAIELHRRLDFTGCQYPVDTEQLFAKAQTISLTGRDYPVLPTTELFLYICYHHSRHQWSRLHWVADLDAIIAHETFDLVAVLNRADELGMSRVVRAVLRLYEVLGGVSLIETQSREDKFTSNLIKDCQHYLQEGSVAPEVESRELNRKASGVWKVRAKLFVYNWRANTKWANRLCYLLSLTQGSYSDYQFLPLPRQLFVLYRLIRPLRWMVESFRTKDVEAGRSPRH